jgi:hypothetical protein
MDNEYNADIDDISVNRDSINGLWRWKIVFVEHEDCYYNDDTYATPGQAADAAWAFIQEHTSND